VNIKKFWVATLYSLVGGYYHFSCLLQMDTTGFSKTSV